MMKTIINWSILKWIRFIIAGFILAYGIYTVDWLLITAGIFLLYMVISNKGCMGGSCENPQK